MLRCCHHSAARFLTGLKTQQQQRDPSVKRSADVATLALYFQLAILRGSYHDDVAAAESLSQLLETFETAFEREWEVQHY